jgi:endonuclease/exonuclease/phosphatase family metal-dependent hydrolase
VDVLRAIDADIIALQEVLSFEDDNPEKCQFRFFVEELGFHCAFGETRRLKGGPYGNVVLSRFPIRVRQNFDITAPGRERRGCLRTDIQIGSSLLHVFNVHFGTAILEHRQQARRLFDERIVSHGELEGTRIVLGDFNEWIRGMVGPTFKTHLQHADVRKYLRPRRTYPGVLPIFNLDHIYFDPELKLEHLQIYRERPALIASDHLPLVADFRLQPYARRETPDFYAAATVSSAATESRTFSRL